MPELFIVFLFFFMGLLLFMGFTALTMAGRWKKSIPSLCGKHASNYLKSGELGLIDPLNCIVCKKTKKVLTSR